jgi:DNA-binding MarR family transcriptional regulator
MNELAGRPVTSETPATGAGHPAAPARAALTESIVDGLIAMYARKLRAKTRPSTWHGTSMAHFVVLSQLVEGDGLPMTTLARTLDVSLPSMTGIADRMASHGLVERVRDPDDRRVVRCRLTSAGRERLAVVESMQRDRITCVLGHLSVRQLERLEVSLSDLAGAFASAEACGDLDRFDQQMNTTEEVKRA